MAKKKVQKKAIKAETKKPAVERVKTVQPDRVEIAGIPFYTIPGLVKEARCSVRHVKEEISRGNLKAFKPAKELLFRVEDVQKWVLRKVA